MEAKYAWVSKLSIMPLCKALPSNPIINDETFLSHSQDDLPTLMDLMLSPSILLDTSLVGEKISRGSIMSNGPDYKMF